MEVGTRRILHHNVTAHPRMGKKLDPIENAGFQQTCLNGAGQR
jgi:hypothetical protein